MFCFLSSFGLRRQKQIKCPVVSSKLGLQRQKTIGFSVQKSASGGNNSIYFRFSLQKSDSSAGIFIIFRFSLQRLGKLLIFWFSLEMLPPAAKNHYFSGFLFKFGLWRQQIINFVKDIWKI